MQTNSISIELRTLVKRKQGLRVFRVSNVTSDSPQYMELDGKGPWHLVDPDKWQAVAKNDTKENSWGKLVYTGAI